MALNIADAEALRHITTPLSRMARAYIIILLSNFVCFISISFTCIWHVARIAYSAESCMLVSSSERLSCTRVPPKQHAIYLYGHTSLWGHHACPIVSPASLFKELVLIGNAYHSKASKLLLLLHFARIQFQPLRSAS